MTFEIPEDVQALSADDLRTAIDDARTEGAAFADIPAADFTDEQIERAEALSTFVTSAKERLTEVEAAAAARAERVAALQSSFAAEEEPPAEEPPAEEPSAEAAAEEETPAEEPAEEPEPVTAAAAPKAKKSPVTQRAARRAPKEEAPVNQAASIIASADVPNISAGADLGDLDGLGKAFQSRLSALPKHRIGGAEGVFQRHATARIRKARDNDLIVQEPAQAMEVFTRASRESSLPGGSLVAAGGWCAPSETLYDLCSIETTEGLLDLPEVQVNRGGIRYTQGPDFSAIYDDLSALGFIQTEAQAEAGTVKPCQEIECPDFLEVRLDAIGLCIKAGILTNAAYPELVRRYIEGLLIAQQHKVSLELINRITALIGPTQPLAGAWDTATADTLAAIELVATGYRQQYRMSFNQTLEVILPHWVLPAFRADLSVRTGVDLTNVTNAMLMDHFAVRQIRPQFVYDWQGLDVTTVPGYATTYPDLLEVLMYPAGSFVKGTTDVIELDSVYDSTGLSTNTYTALFAEEGILVAQMCTGGRRFSLPLGVTGKTAIANVDQDFGATV